MSFDNLPEELLNLIFKGLSARDLNQCLKVCRSWNKPVTLLRLERVYILNSFKLDKLLNCIDLDPQPLCFRAVKEIVIEAFTDYFGLPDCTASIKRLLLRLPSLKDIIIYENGLTQHLLDDEFSISLSQNCKQLRSFTIDSHMEMSRQTSIKYHGFMYQLRHMLKSVRLHNYEQGDPIEYLAAFPQLKEAEFNTLVNLQSWLPLFERHSGLEKLTCTIHSKEEEEEKWEFADGHAMENLSKLKELYLTEEGSTINPKLVDFLCRYVSGLCKFSLIVEWSTYSEDTIKSVFCHHLLDYVCRLDCFSIFIYSMIQTTFSECLQPMTQKVFRQSSGDNTLHLDLYNTYESTIQLKLNKTRLKRTIEIRYPCCCLLFDKVRGPLFPNCHVDMLQVTLSCGHFEELSDYLELLLDELSSVKKVVLDTSSIYNLTTHTSICIPKQYSHITHLQMNFSKVLDIPANYITMFPNLKYLKMFDYCGSWNKELYEYQINVDGWNLERLSVDVTPLNETPSKKAIFCDLEYYYFVIAVDIKQRGKQYLYKVSKDDLRITRINDRNMEDQKSGQHSPKLHITVTNLEYLDLHMVTREGELEHNMNAKISFV